MGFGFVGAALLLLTLGLLYPAVRTIVKSFMNRNGTEFVGLDNYVRAFTEPQFLVVLRNTAIWVLVAPAVATVVGLVYAILVDRARFESVAKALVFLPMAISMVGASLIWKFVYQFKPTRRRPDRPAQRHPLALGVRDRSSSCINAPLNTFC